MEIRRLLRSFVLAAMMARAADVSAHAIVTGSSLDHAPVHAGAPMDVTLKLNSQIERAFTRVALVDAKGATTPLELAAEDTPGKIIVRLPALAPGRYGLRYRVLAADGHVTESIIRFTVEP